MSYLGAQRQVGSFQIPVKKVLSSAKISQCATQNNFRTSPNLKVW